MTSSTPGTPPRPSRRPPADVRLVQGVRDPAIRTHVAMISGQTLAALTDLSRLDESLYVRFMEGGGNVVDEGAPRVLLTRLATVTFRGLRTLLAYLARLDPSGPPSVEDDGGSFEFDVDESGADPAPAQEDQGSALDLSDVDIDGALDVIGEGEERDETTRWDELREKLAAIEYGLRTQLGAFDQHFEEAVAGKQIAQALEALDDARSAVGEGLFAVIVVVYQTFAPHVDPSTVAPGYLSSLESALLVRRGVTDLLRAVERDNARVQAANAAPGAADEAYARIRTTLRGFLAAPVFRAMRPADRWELTKFERLLGEQTSTEGRLTCEGFAKYLDSLGAVNRREVLQTHDERALKDLRDLLANARALIAMNFGLAADMARQAIALAERLYGRNAINDELLAALRDAAPSLTSESEVEGVLDTLELFLDDTGG